MKVRIFLIAIYLLTIASSHTVAQEKSESQEVVITGARFTYPLIRKWIDEYHKVNPSVRIVIAPRTSKDPDNYDLLIEAFEPTEELKQEREYLYLARYALLPIANAHSAFAKKFGEKGLTKKLIKQLYFDDLYADRDKQEKIDEPYTIYTRLQEAGAPTTFASYFGFTQKDIKGKAIAGADEHLVKALLKDSTGLSYSTAGLIYDLDSRKIKNGISVLPVDLDDNGRVASSERFPEDLDQVIQVLEQDDIKNIPVEHIHLSLKKLNHKREALEFLLWVLHNSQDDIHQFGFLKPDPKRFEKEKKKFEQLASK